jgi:hypothetical protein
VDQLGSGQAVQLLSVPERVFQIPPGHACMLARQHFGPHPFPVGDGFHNDTVLVGADQK